MAGITWQPEEDAYLRAHPTTPPVELTDALTANGRTIDACIQRRMRLRQKDVAAELGTKSNPNRIVLPPSTHEIDPPITIPHQDVALLFDVHVNYHDAPFMEKVLDTATATGITTLILGGDFIDVSAFSKFGGDPQSRFDLELEMARDLLAPILERFTVYWITGNHESRWFKHNNFQLGMKHLRRLLTDSEKLTMSKYAWMNMEPSAKSGSYPWHLSHPKNSSIIPGRIPSMLASRRWTGHHVISGHGHLVALLRSDEGKRWCWDIGIGADPGRIDYATYEDSIRPVMQRGAGLILGDQPVMLWPGMDWNRLLNGIAVTA